MRRIASCAVMVALVLVLAAPVFSAVYFWKDEKGVVHMTDRKPEESGAKVEVIGQPEKPGKKETREEKVAEMQKAAAAHPRFLELSAIARDYNKNHSYSMVDLFVCIDMALEMYNILKTKGFNPKVVAGDVKTDLSAVDKKDFAKYINHAWTVVELEPGLYVPIETTAGVVIGASNKNSANFYQGLVFENPKQAKDYNPLIAAIKETCNTAHTQVEEFDKAYQGRPATQLALEAKGRAEAKIKECNDNIKKREELFTRLYRTLY